MLRKVIVLVLVGLGLAVVPGAKGAKFLLSMPMIVNTPSQHILLGAITEPLVSRGHEVILLAPENNITKGLSEDAITRTINFKNSLSKEEMQDIIDNVSATVVMTFSQGSMFQVFKGVKDHSHLLSEGCHKLWADKDTLRRLQEEKFDLVISMPFGGCDALLTEYLQVPSIAMTPVRRAPALSEDTNGMSVPSSYVPLTIFPLLLTK